MASGEASIVVRLIDKASAGLKNIGSGLGALKAHYLAVSASVAGLTTFLVSSIKAFGEQELAVRKLENALRNQGIASNDVSKDLQEYATQLQRVSVFEDEAIMAGQALLISFGLTGEKLKDATKAAVELASGLDIDLRTAMLMVGKAAQGQTEVLGRYGIKIKDGLPASEKFAALLGVVNNRFGGSAQANASSYSGQVTRLTHAFGDLQEKVGAQLAPTMSRLLELMIRGVELAEKYSGAMFEAAKNSAKAALATNPVVAAMKSLNFFMGKNAGDDALAKGNADLVRSRQDVARAKQAAQRAESQAVEEESRKFIESKRLEVEEHGLSEDEKTFKKKEAEAERLLALGESELAGQAIVQAQDQFFDARSAQAKEREKDMASQRVAVVQNMLSGIMSLNIQHNKGLIALQKAAGIAQVMINTANAVQGAWAAYSKIPFAGPALASALIGIIVASSAAQIAAISGVQLAEGGIVMPRSGGTQAIIGEAGRSEAVIPLGDRRAQEQIREALGGAVGGVTINLYAQYADRAAFQEFVGKIDEELFRRRRNGKDYYS